MNKKSNIAIAICLIAGAVGLRLAPHAANFAPVAAVAIFGGAVLPRRLAIWVPLAAMIASDTFIGFYNTMLVTWACYGLIALASSYWLRKLNFGRSLSLTLGSSLFFFLVTNFATWLWSGMYLHTAAGLVKCYQMALPFFRNTAVSDLFYTGALFGLYALTTQASGRLVRFYSSRG